MSFDLNSGSGEINTIENCAELAITHHTMAYRNYPSPAEKEYAKKNFPQVAFCLPINNPRAVKRSSMVVKVNGQQVQTIYGEYSKFCRKEGISMSKRIENFIKKEMERIKTNLVSKEILKTVSKETKEIDVSSHSFSKYC